MVRGGGREGKIGVEVAKDMLGRGLAYFDPGVEGGAK